MMVYVIVAVILGMGVILAGGMLWIGARALRPSRLDRYLYYSTLSGLLGAVAGTAMPVFFAVLAAEPRFALLALVICPMLSFGAFLGTLMPLRTARKFREKYPELWESYARRDKLPEVWEVSARRWTERER